MKRIFSIVVVCFGLLLTLCACTGTEEKPKVEIMVEYTTTVGGTIEGEQRQTKTVEQGKSASFSLVTAVASEGYRFVGWSDGRTERFRVDSLTENGSFQAIFEKIPMGTISYLATQGGKIQGEATQTLQAGAITSRVTAIADDTYHFVGWSDGKAEPTRFDIVEGDLEITAIFSNEVVVEYLATEGGYIFGLTSQRLTYGQTTQRVMAVASQGYRFVGWSDELVEQYRTDLAKENKTLTAIFKKYFTLEASSGNPDKGSVEGPLTQTVDQGEICQTLTAVPKEGYSFICWSDGSSNPTISRQIAENESLVAFFGDKSYGMPVISIETEDGADVDDKINYKNCVITVNDTATQNHILWVNAQIKGRGNSTWKMEKKPYKIKFDTKQDLFGFGKAKDWVLLNNHIDKSLMRNFLAYRLAGAMSSLENAPDCLLVEVYMNGRYDGVYLLCEQVEINEHRVEVSEDTNATDTGYLVEMDGWADGVCVSVPDSLNGNRKYAIKGPEEEFITENHKKFIEQYLKDCLNAINGTDYELVKFLVDVESFAQAYIIFELFKNPDVNYSSFYLCKDAGGKLAFGPVWDFDMCLGNVNHKGNDVKKYNYLWAKNTNPWFKGLLAHEEFAQRVAELLDEYQPIFEAELTKYYKEAYENQGAYEQNFIRWKVMNICVQFEPSEIVALGSWEKNVEWTKTYLKNSFDFLQATYDVKK